MSVKRKNMICERYRNVDLSEKNKLFYGCIYIADFSFKDFDVPIQFHMIKTGIFM